MKKLLYGLLLFISFNSVAQDPKIRMAVDTLKTDLFGQPLDKGDEFIVAIQLHANSNTTVRSLYFDIEFPNTVMDWLTAGHTGTGGNGGYLPYGSNITMDMYVYPGYSWVANAQNTTTNGTVNYENAAYQYTEGGPKSIARIYLNWATANGLPYNEWGNLIWIRFRLRADAVGSVWDPVKLNFAAAYNQDGTSNPTIMENPKTTVTMLNPDAQKLVKLKLDLPATMNPSDLKLGLRNTADNTVRLYDITSTGQVNVIDSLVAPNTQYQMMAFVNMDKMGALYNAAVTISDYAAAQAEYIQQNLDGTFKGNSIMTGMGYKAADVNFNGKFDGGDLTKLFSQAVNVNQLVQLPSGYTVGSNGWMSIPLLEENLYNNLGKGDWASALPAQGQPSFTITTPAQRGTPLNYNLKYFLYGDINRSHSSPAVQNGNVRVNSFINTATPSAGSINVSLKNITVLSNSIEIPVAISGDQDLSGLQFEFKYDASKIKFENLKADVPDGWYVFANNQEGLLKFGALDKDLAKPIKGSLTPFKLKFTALQSGVDLNTLIKVSPVMDATAPNGLQVGINLNTDTIKLTGYNNF